MSMVQVSAGQVSAGQVSAVRVAARLPRIEAGSIVAAPDGLRDDDWSEIEAFLVSPPPSGERHAAAARRLGRGIVALVATGVLALAGLAAFEQTCQDCRFPRVRAEMAAMRSPTMAVPPRTQTESARATSERGTLEEGRSVAAGTDQPAAVGDGSLADPAARHRHGHRHKHH